MWFLSLLLSLTPFRAQLSTPTPSLRHLTLSTSVTKAMGWLRVLDPSEPAAPPRKPSGIPYCLDYPTPEPHPQGVAPPRKTPAGTNTNFMIPLWVTTANGQFLRVQPESKIGSPGFHSTNPNSPFPLTTLRGPSRSRTLIMTSELYSESFESQFILSSSSFGYQTQPMADEKQWIVKQNKRYPEGKGAVDKVAKVKTTDNFGIES